MSKQVVFLFSLVNWIMRDGLGIVQVVNLVKRLAFHIGAGGQAGRQGQSQCYALFHCCCILYVVLSSSCSVYQGVHYTAKHYREFDFPISHVFLFLPNFALLLYYGS